MAAADIKRERAVNCMGFRINAQKYQNQHCDKEEDRSQRKELKTAPQLHCSTCVSTGIKTETYANTLLTIWNFRVAKQKTFFFSFSFLTFFSKKIKGKKKDANFPCNILEVTREFKARQRF